MTALLLFLASVAPDPAEAVRPGAERWISRGPLLLALGGWLVWRLGSLADVA